jgi:glycosyltransferase involved in cell wall biosynthesis
MTVYVVDLESVESRYTCEWKTHVPELLKDQLDCEVVVVDGGDVPPTVTPGAFLNFGGTNIYKSRQLEQIAQLFCQNKIKDGDYFLYTDAWNPTVTQLKYMSSLLGINIRIGGLFHAGSWDSQDFLGRLVGNTPWVRHLEKSLFHTFDHNYFATDFHIQLFVKELLDDGQAGEHVKKIPEYVDSGKIVLTGWPMEYFKSTFEKYQNTPKRDLILFPHRIAPEKQPDIFRDLSHALPEYDFVICQEQQLTKSQYHQLLAEAKIVFSANLQETLGISSCAEAPILNAIPLVPNRLSYREIFKNYQAFVYPSEWTTDWNAYQLHKEEIINLIKHTMQHQPQLTKTCQDYVLSDYENFFNSQNMISTIRKSIS